MTNWISSANWDSFFPDLIVGAVTGLIVGAVLLLVQSQAEHAAVVRQLRREWAALQPRLAPHLARTTRSQDVIDDFTNPAKSIRAIQTLLSESPTAMWASELKGAVHENVHRLLVASYEVEYLGQRLETFLVYRLRLQLGNLSYPPNMSQVVPQAAFIRARALGLWAGELDLRGSSEIEEVTNAILESDQFRSLFQPYHDALAELMASIDEVSVVVDEDAFRAEPRSR